MSVFWGVHASGQPRLLEVRERPRREDRVGRGAGSLPESTVPALQAPALHTESIKQPENKGDEGVPDCCLKHRQAWSRAREAASVKEQIRSASKDSG